jgi:hypothetical protein
MLLWEETHPYNGAHVLRLAGPANVALWREAIEAAAGRRGLGLLAIDRTRATYTLEPGGPIDLRPIEPGGSSADEALWKAVRAGMNNPFPAGPHHPVRWTIVNDPASDTHYLAAVYRHVAADAASLGAIIAEATSRYLGITPREEPAAGVLAGARAGAAAPGKRLRGLVRAAGLYFRLRRCHRMRLRRDAGEETDFVALDAPRGLLGSLSAVTGRRGATVHDSFLAALASALAAATPGRREHPTRRSLALGFVADLRGERAGDDAPLPGVRVGQAVIVIDEPDEPRSDVLLERIARLTRAEKVAGSLGGTPWRFLALSRLERWIPRAGARAWYRKVHPLAAGVSNVRWREEAFGGGDRRVLAYYRIAPPGPALPLVVTPTTLGDNLTFGFSYHAGSFDRHEASRLAAMFIARLESLAAGNAAS